MSEMACHQHGKSVESQPASYDDSVPNWFHRILVLLMFIIFTAFILSLAISQTLVPHLPEVKLKSAPLVNVLNVSTDQVTSNWEIVFVVKNPNRVDMSYANMDALMLANQKLISSSATISTFDQHGYEETEAAAKFEGVTMVVDDWSIYDAAANRNSGTVNLNVTLKAIVATSKKWAWPLKSWLIADCNNLKVIFFKDSTGTAMGGSTDCNVKGKWLAVMDILDNTYLSCGGLVVLVWFIGSSLGQKYKVKGKEPTLTVSK